MWISETVTDLFWQNTKGLLQFFPAPKKDISL